MLQNEGLRSIQSSVNLEQENRQQGIELSEREINEIIIGVQISDIEIQYVEDWINNRSMKILNWISPNVVYGNMLKSVAV